MKSFRQACEEADAICWICQEVIDYSLPNWHDFSYSLDHYQPKHHRPDLENDKGNWRPSHSICNNRRGSLPPRLTIWVGTKEEGYWKHRPNKKYFWVDPEDVANHQRKNKPKPLVNTPPLTWADRWATSGPLKDNGTPTNPYARTPDIHPSGDPTKAPDEVPGELERYPAAPATAEKPQGYTEQWIADYQKKYGRPPSYAERWIADHHKKYGPPPGPEHRSVL